MRMKIEINPQKVYASIIAYMLSFLSFVTLVNGINNGIGLATEWDTYIFVAILLCMLLVGFFVLLFENLNSCVDSWILIAFFACSYLFSLIFFPQNSKYLFTALTDFFGNPVYSIFLLSLPGYLFARHLSDYSLFCCIMRRCACVVVVLSIILFFFMRDSFATQYLSFSYNMLLHLLFLVLYKPKNRRIWHNIIVVLGVFVFVVGGARGALVSFLVCCVAYILITRKKMIQNIVITMLASGGVCVFMIMKNEILAFLLPLLTKMNIDSRTIKMMLASEIMNSSGRDEIAKEVINNINIFGHGMMGDRVVCSGLYAHNLFLELMCDFGLILGSVLSLIIIVLVVVGILRKIKRNQAWILLLLSTGFLKLMLSGSFLDIEPAFYVLMGLCVNSFMENRTDDQVIKENLYNDKISPKKCVYWSFGKR